MTTATPTLDPLAEPLLDVPDRRVCEGKVNVGGQTLATARWAPCEHGAEWIVHATFSCGHQPSIALLYCDFHKDTANDGGCDWLMSDGLICAERISVHWIEALR